MYRENKTVTLLSRFLAGIIVSGLLSLIIAAPFPAGAVPVDSSSLDPVTLQLKWKHQFQFAGYYAALEKGFYEKEGLAVTIREADEESRKGELAGSVAAVINDEAQFGVALSDLVTLRAKGYPVVALAAIFQHSPLVLLAPKSAGIQSIHDLPGKRLALEEHSEELLAYMLDEGIARDSLTIVDHDYNVNQLLSGQIDAISAYSTDEPYMLMVKNIPYAVFSPRAGGIDFYGDTLFTTKDQIKHHPRRVAAFRKASLAGWAYALDHPEEMIDLILSRYSRRHSREHLRFEAQKTRQLILPDVVEIGYMNPGRWRYIAERYRQFGIIPEDFSLAGFLYKPDAGPINWQHWTVRAGLATVCIGLLVILALLIFNKRLNREIDNRQEAETRLRRSEKLFRKVFEILPVGLWTTDKDGQILEGNPEGVRIWGGGPQIGPSEYSVFKARRLPSGEEIQPDDWALSHTIRKGETIADELLEIDALDGQKRKILNFTAPVKDDDGTLLGAIVVNNDITTRFATEEALETSRRELQSFLDASPDLFFLKDPAFQYRLNNRANMEYFRNTDTGVDITGKTDFDIMPEYAARSSQESDKAAVEQRQSIIHYETIGKKIFEVRKSPVIVNDEVIGLVGLVRDITEHKSLEKQLLQAQKMESIGVLAGGIAHDFNNILSSIIGFSELALDDAAEGTLLADNLQEIYTAGKRARELVKQILTFARQGPEEKKPIRVDTITKETLKLLRSSIPTTIDIESTIDSDALILGDPTQLHQILMNLCTNAAQSMEEQGGVLTVTLQEEVRDTASVQQVDLRPGVYLKLTVSDTGAGIPDDIIGSIFDPYFTTKPKGEGTGLGLATVHGIVKNHDGEIRVASPPGRGAEFVIYFPVTTKTTEDLPYEIQALPTGTERVLLVDDELAIARMASQVLTRLGYAVTFRTSSIEALELFKARAHDFDLIITDTTMPNMSGGELAREILSVRPDMPIILCTGYSKTMTPEAAEEIGIKAFVYKPIIKADLARAIRNVLDRNG